MKTSWPLILVFLLPSASRSDEILLNELLLAHKAATQYFQTISCEVETLKVYPKKSVLAAGTYLRSGNRALLNLGNEQSGIDHFLLHRGEIRGVGRSRWEEGEPTSFNAFRWPKSDNRTFADPFTEMLLNFQLPDNSYGTLEELLQSLTKKPLCKKTNLNGKEFIELQIYYETKQNSKIFTTYLFDIRKNYLATKADMRFQNNDITVSESCTDFFEVSRGVFFPKSLSRVGYRNGKKLTELTVTVSNLRVNEPIPEETLALPPIPDGTILIDNILGKEGPIDANWQWIGRPGKSVGTTLGAATPGGGAAPTQTESEPWNFGTLIGFAGVSLMILCGLFYSFFILKK